MFESKIKKEHLPQITEMRKQGLTFKEIAAKLNEQYNLDIKDSTIIARLKYEAKKLNPKKSKKSKKKKSNIPVEIKEPIPPQPAEATLKKLEEPIWKEEPVLKTEITMPKDKTSIIKIESQEKPNIQTDKPTEKKSFLQEIYDYLNKEDEELEKEWNFDDKSEEKADIWK